LLNRTTRSVTPTETGARLLQRLRPALEEIDAAFNDLDDNPQRPVGTLRLNVPVPTARFVLPNLIPAFLERYPGVSIEVAMDNTHIDIFAAGYDAGVRYEESLAKDMIAVPIGPRRQRFAAAASPRYLEKNGVPRHPRDLLTHRLIGHRFESGKLGVWEFERKGDIVRIPPQGAAADVLTGSRGRRGGRRRGDYLHLRGIPQAIARRGNAFAGAGRLVAGIRGSVPVLPRPPACAFATEGVCRLSEERGRSLMLAGENSRTLARPR